MKTMTMAVWMMTAALLVGAQTLKAAGGIGVPESISISGKRFYDVRYGPVTGTNVFISHRSGSMSVPVCLLPSSVLKRLGLDPSAVASARQTQLKAAREAEAANPGQRFITTVEQVCEAGLLVKGSSRSLDSREFLLVGHPGQRSRVDGETLRFSATRAGNFSFTTVLGARRTVEKWNYVPDAGGQAKAPETVTPPSAPPGTLRGKILDKDARTKLVGMKLVKHGVWVESAGERIFVHGLETDKAVGDVIEIAAVEKGKTQQGERWFQVVK